MQTFYGKKYAKVGNKNLLFMQKKVCVILYPKHIFLENKICNVSNIWDKGAPTYITFGMYVTHWKRYIVTNNYPDLDINNKNVAKNSS